MNSRRIINDETRQDLHLIYTTSIGDIRFAKQQQWRLTYYALLLIIGIFYLRSSNELHLFWHIVLVLITLVIAISAVLLIIEIEKDLHGYRSTMIKIENALSNEFKRFLDSLEIKEKDTILDLGLGYIEKIEAREEGK